jgi:hypothetical protein
MRKDKALKTALDDFLGSPTETATAVVVLQDKVKQLYKLLDVAIKLRLNRDERTSRNSAPLTEEEQGSNTDPEKTMDDAIAANSGQEE